MVLSTHYGAGPFCLPSASSPYHLEYMASYTVHSLIQVSIMLARLAKPTTKYLKKNYYYHHHHHHDHDKSDVLYTTST